MNDLVGMWHESDCTVGLNEFVGLSWKEYADWVTDNMLPEDFLERHGFTNSSSANSGPTIS